MSFSSPLFLFGFLPVFLALYLCVPARWKNAMALSGSIVFYAWGAPGFLPVIILTTFVDQRLALALPKGSPSTRRRLLMLSIVLNVGCLFYFKYWGFFFRQMGCVDWQNGSWFRAMLPLGLSFITFQRLSYVFDVYRGKITPVKDVLQFLLFVFLFPKVVQGPIARYAGLGPQIVERPHSVDRCYRGLLRFVLGLAKKVLIADVLGEVADAVFALDPAARSLPYAWVGALTYTFQIYFDFSGYTDMAIGMGSCMGFELPENFDRPYLSQTISEFWRRWHITLSTWLRDYLFLPVSRAIMDRIERRRLLGMKVETAVYVVSTIVTMSIAGLWHGANETFVAWGLFHGMFLVCDKLFWMKRARRLPKPVTIPIAFLIVVFGWVLFRSPSLQSAASFAGSMLSVTHLQSTVPSGEVASVRSLCMLAVAGLLCFMPLMMPVREAGERSPNVRGWFTRIEGAALIGLFILSVSRLVNSSFHPFIYFKF